MTFDKEANPFFEGLIYKKRHIILLFMLHL